MTPFQSPKVCRRCNGIAKESKALINKPENAEDFGNDKGKSGTTNTLSKDTILVNCWKCSECGHSFI